jgi:hypothetical protein
MKFSMTEQEKGDPLIQAAITLKNKAFFTAEWVAL